MRYVVHKYVREMVKEHNVFLLISCILTGDCKYFISYNCCFFFWFVFSSMLLPCLTTIENKKDRNFSKLSIYFKSKHKKNPA